MYSLGTWFVSGMCVDTLHKGENHDDDYNNNNKLLLFIIILMHGI
jgi:hypothetical protein